MGRDALGITRILCLLLFVASSCLVACNRSRAASPSEVHAASESRGEKVEYSFAGADGELIGSSTLQGRVTVLLFVTTFDLGSQVQAKRLEDLYRTHAPRINAVAVVLEAPRYVDLARSFKQVLELNYPIAMADQATLVGRGPFGTIDTVPTWVVLDRRGVLRKTLQGPLSPGALETLVENVQR